MFKLPGAMNMGKTVRAVFDGEVLRTEEPIDLRPDTTYFVTIEHATPSADDLAGVREAVGMTT
jgi:hypothetical protein